MPSRLLTVKTYVVSSIGSKWTDFAEVGSGSEYCESALDMCLFFSAIQFASLRWFHRSSRTRVAIACGIHVAPATSTVSTTFPLCFTLQVVSGRVCRHTVVGEPGFLHLQCTLHAIRTSSRFIGERLR